MKLIFCMHINMKLSYKFSWLLGIARPTQITPQKTSLQSLCNISRKKWGWSWFLCNEHHHFHFWCVWPGIPKVLKITCMRCLYNISRKNWVMKLIYCMLLKIWWGVVFGVEVFQVGEKRKFLASGAETPPLPQCPQ